MNRGGKREGAGVKPGTGTRNAAKPEDQKRTIKKSYNWTPEEYERIQDAVKVSGVKESKIVQSGTLQRVNEILETGTYNKALEADLKNAGEN